MNRVWLCFCVLVATCISVWAESERSAKVASDKPNKDRQPYKKFAHPKPKLHYTTTATHTETKYGVDLPSFAFDYSEYFSGAIIERSSGPDLYLSIFMVGHKSVSTDFPFHAISTDEEVMHSWSKAIKLWDKTSHKRTSASNVRQLTEVSPRGPHSTQPSHAHSSGLVCVLQNNDASPSQVYQTSAYWVQAEHDADSTSNKNIFAVLRCNLRASATHTPTNKELFVDIMRLNTHKKPHSRHSSRTNSTSSASSGASAPDSAVSSDSRGSVLSSFSVPWSTRVVGYPLQHHTNASTLDPWATSSVNNGNIHQNTPTTTATTTTTTPPVNTTSTLLCVPSVRPLHPRRPVSLSQLVEYIEHNLLLGFAHIMLGVALDWKSQHMHKHLHVLQSYIRTGQVSLYSTALPGFDDVSGFGGVELNDVYAEHYFANMCVYYAKGVYGYVSVGRVDEFIVPGEAYLFDSEGSSSSSSSSSSAGGSISTSTSTSSSFVHSIVNALVSGAGASNKVATTTRGTSKVHSNSVIQYAPCTYALTTHTGDTTTSVSTSSSGSSSKQTTNLRGSTTPATHTTNTNATSVDKSSIGRVTGQLDVYGVEDPVSADMRGSGESVWSRDFFASSTPKPLTDTNTAYSAYSVLLLPTDRVVRVDVAPSGVVTGRCRSALSQQRRSKYNTHGAYTSSSNSTSSGTSTSGVVKRVSTMYTTTATVSTPDVALFVYKNTVGSHLTTASTSTTTTPVQTALHKYTHIHDMMHNITSTRLAARSLSPTSIKALTQESLALFKSSLNSAQSAQPFNPFSDAPIPNKNQLSGEIPTRSVIKAPFWQLCNTDFLKDVIRKVFHS